MSANTYIYVYSLRILTEYLQDAFPEVEFQVVGLEFALSYGRIFL